MSALLQEAGFEAKDIRIVLDGRATARAVRERLHWLLDGTRAGDERLFFYSGHGAQIPAYGAFTYHMAKLLREAQRRRRAPDLAKAVQAVGARLKELGYEQAPVLVGAKAALKQAGKMLAG